jgi:hypothetical protein
MEFGAAEPCRPANRGGAHTVTAGPPWRQSPAAAAKSLSSPPGPAKACEDPSDARASGG